METTRKIVYFLVLVCLPAVLWSCSSARQSTDEQRSAQQRSAQADTIQQLLERVEPGKAREYVIQGSVLQMQKRYAEAVIEFQQALRYDNSPAIHFAIASNYYELSKPDLAVEHLRTAVELDPDFSAAYHLLGEIYVSQFRLDEAIRVYRHLMETDPSEIVRFTLARIYEFRDIDKALEIYTEMLEDSEDIAVLERLVEIYERRGDTARAVTALERLYNAAPDNETIPPVLLQRYLETGDYDRAFILLEQIDNTLPSTVVPRYYLAFGNVLLRELDSSKFAAGQAARFIAHTDQVFQDVWQVQLMRGMLAGGIGDTSLSDRLFESTLYQADSLPEVPLQVAVYYLQEQRYQAMANVTKRYEKRFTDDPRFPFFTALALSRLQQGPEAILALQRSVAIDTSYVEAWVQLGIEYNLSGDLERSDAAYEKALELDPGNALANNNYAYSLSERGEQLARARDMAEIALAEEPDNASYLDTMGWIYYQLGDYEQALDFILRAIAHGDASATVYEHLGDTYDRLGRTEEAVEAWQKALDIDPAKESLRQRLDRRK